MISKINLADYTNDVFSVILSDNYKQFMEDTVEPYLNKLRNTVKLKSKTTDRIHSEYYLLTSVKNNGTIFISHGFTESTQKYHEMIYYMLQSGYNVCIMDHKNHGLSRPDGVEDVASMATHIDHFQTYVHQMDVVVRQVLKRYLPAPYYLFCHSMGGAIGSTYLEQHPGTFEKAVLSSPMLEINTYGIPAPVVNLVSSVQCIIGHGKHFLAGQGTFSSTPNFEGSAATSEARYLYYQEKQVRQPYLQNSGASNRWAKEAAKAIKILLAKRNCAKITIPVLLFQAEKDDFVLPGGQDQFISRIPNGQLVFIPGSKHEAYMTDDATMSHYFAAILQFLSSKNF